MKIQLGSLSGVVLLVAAACDVEAIPDGEADFDGGIEEFSAALSVGPTKLSNSAPTGLVAAADFLYWTSQEIDAAGPDSASVWRGSTNTHPGAEGLIYRQLGDSNETSFYGFGEVAQVSTAGGSFTFFVNNYSVDGFTGAYILRVPSAGGGVAVVGASDYVGDGQLVADGSSVFWSDWSSIYRAPAVAGPQATLVGDSSPLLALSGSHVYYGDGATIRRVAKAGGASETVITAPDAITALYVFAPTSAFGVAYWGEQGGAVRSQSVLGGPTTTY
ncbi:MAG TPA: hypothetical protein VK698_13900 [Kofleriaceae bacterium]|nr:hypothetical protein [Kofleriaceae bacterium]